MDLWSGMEDVVSAFGLLASASAGMHISWHY